MNKLAAVLSVSLISALGTLKQDEAKSDDLAEGATAGDWALGAFSVSLEVKDIQKSKVFYEALGFKPVMGDIKQNWLILRNENKTTIGLFQGMFKGNIMTFNPGWDMEGKPLESFTDIREIQKSLIENGIELETKADLESEGPASLTLVDPDGNRILLDQHL